MKDFLVRNQGLISKEVQEKIEKARILLVGCGLGSQIAVLAARTGFMNFELWDGDKVEEHNLNRQVFNFNHIGLNKAKVTAQLIKSINPKAKVKAYQRFLRDPKDIVKAVRRNDFILNMADPDEAMWKISELAHLENKVELHPLNAGWTGYCLILTPTTPSLETITGEKICGIEFYPRLIESTLGKISFSIEKEDFRKFLSGEIPFPQIGITSYLTASLAVTAMVRWLAQDFTLPLAPKPFWLSVWK